MQCACTQNLKPFYEDWQKEKETYIVVDAFE